MTGGRLHYQTDREMATHDETIETHAFGGFQSPRGPGITEGGCDDGRIGGTLWRAAIADSGLAEAVGGIGGGGVRTPAGTGAEGFGAGVEGIAREDRSTDDGAGFSVGKVVALARPERTALMDAGAKLARKRQCELLQVSRASWYRRSTPREAEVRLKHRLDQWYPKRPYLGSRRLTVALRRDGETINRKRVQRLMRELKWQAVYPKPRTTRPEPTHARYPYLLREVPVTRPNQVWAADPTYIPMAQGNLYLVAVMDWGQSPGVVMAVVEFVGCERLRVGVAGGSGTPWPTGDLQYRSR